MVLGSKTHGGHIDEFDNQLDDPNGFSDHAGEDPASLSVWEHLKALSVSAKLTLVYINLVLVALLIYLHWVIALMSVLAFLLSAGPLFVWWTRIRFSCPLDLVVRSFGLGMIGMFWSVVVLMAVCIYGPIRAVIVAVFRSNVAQFVALFVILVGLEEMMKVVLALWSKRDVAVGRETKAHQIAATAVSVGYAVGFSFVTIMLLDLVVDVVLHIKPESWSDALVGLFVLALTTLFGTPLHVLSGYLVGLEVKRETTFMKAALYSFALRSLFQINIIVWIVIGDSWQMIVFGILLTNVLLCAAMVRRIKAVESTLPIEYLQRVGYLQAFGYGILPGDEVDGVEIPNSVDVNTLV